jgi:hypothetical protein
MRSMLPVRILVTVVMASLSTAVVAQSGTVMECFPAPPLISVDPPTPDSTQPVTIQVSVDSGGGNATVVSSLGAVISGNIINVTLVGFTFGPAPPHLPLCGLVPLAPLPVGTYVVNYFWSVGPPPFLLGSSSFAVTDSISGNTIPTLSSNAVVILALLIALVAAVVISSRKKSPYG